MSQDYVLPVGTDTEAVAITVRINNALEALRTMFAGATEPTAKTPYQPWLDTSTGMLRVRNAANSAWLPVIPFGTQQQVVVPLKLSGALGAAEFQFAVPFGCTVQRVVIVTDTTTTASSGTDEWAFMLENVTQTLDLFSSAPGTGTAVSGVGGGEATADAAYQLTVDQNESADALDVLRLTVTQTGTPTAVPDVSIHVHLVAA